MESALLASRTKAPRDLTILGVYSNIELKATQSTWLVSFPSRGTLSTRILMLMFHSYSVIQRCDSASLWRRIHHHFHTRDPGVTQDQFSANFRSRLPFYVQILFGAASNYDG